MHATRGVLRELAATQIRLAVDFRPFALLLGSGGPVDDLLPGLSVLFHSLKHPAEAFD